MTTNAIVDDGRMIHRRRQPRRGCMTNVAFFHGHNMQGVFAGCNDAVMTGGTTCRNLRVIERTHRQRFPRCRPRCMTSIAHVSGRHMNGGFTASNRAIMTVDASAHDLSMID